jgi:Domain of unknown function (DUF1929)/Kelch motif
MPWNPTLVDSAVLAVHAAFLDGDQIVYFGGDQHDPKLAEAHKTDATCLYDCRTGAVQRITSPPFDLFCCGHSISALGTLLAAGGTAAFPDVVPGLHHEHFPGVRDSAIFRFEPGGPGWRSTADMNHGAPAPGVHSADTGGRWYPTLITLANGDVLALSGHPAQDDREHTNYIPEVFTPTPGPGGSWHRLGSYTDPAQDTLFRDHETTYYPRGHLLPTGDVVLTSPARDRTTTLRVNRAPWSGAFFDVCRFTPGESGQYLGFGETSVLLPLLAEDGYRRRRVLVTGGDQPWILDLTDWNPGTTPSDQLNWQKTAPRALAGSPRRINGHAVLLPTGEVLCVGGVAGLPDGSIPDATAVRTPEIFDPTTDTWSALTATNEQEQVVRNYHSVALLMPDGRVWTAGSDHNGGRGTGPTGAADLRIEIYEPWYHGNPNRPEITAAPDHWVTGQQFILRTTQAPEIRRVAMVRTGSCTHAFNPDQRYITLEFRHQGGDDLLVTAPPNGNIAPTGMYFLFTINDQGLPSAGTRIYHNGDPRTEAEQQWDGLFRG